MMTLFSPLMKRVLIYRLSGFKWLKVEEKSEGSGPSPLASGEDVKVFVSIFFFSCTQWTHCTSFTVVACAV